MYAQSVIEVGNVRYNPGDAVPESIGGYEDLVKDGSIAPTKPTRDVTINSDNQIVATEDPVLGATIARFDGDFTEKDIANPKKDTPIAGVHRTEAEHRAQDPEHYNALEAAS